MKKGIALLLTLIFFTPVYADEVDVVTGYDFYSTEELQLLNKLSDRHLELLKKEAELNAKEQELNEREALLNRNKVALPHAQKSTPDKIYMQLPPSKAAELLSELPVPKAVQILSSMPPAVSGRLIDKMPMERAKIILQNMDNPQSPDKE